MFRFISICLVLFGLAGCSSQESLLPDPTETVSESLGKFGTLVSKIEVEYGFDATSADWAEVRDSNCDPTSDQLWFPSLVSDQFDEATQQSIATKSWAASLIANCPTRIEFHSLGQEEFDAFASLDNSFTAEKYLDPGIRLESLGQFGVLAAELERSYNFEATLEEWASARDRSCGGFTSTQYVIASPPITNNEAKVRAWAAAVVTTCPSAITSYRWEGENLAALTWADSGFASQLNQSTGGDGGNYAPPATGGGYTVQCNDGTFSNSGGKQGACSWHGGVAG